MKGAALLLLAVSLVACAREDPWLEPHQRLADLLQPPQRAWKRPTATLSDERRTLLRGQTRAPIVRRGAARVKSDGWLHLSKPLPAELRGPIRGSSAGRTGSMGGHGSDRQTSPAIHGDPF